MTKRLLEGSWDVTIGVNYLLDYVKISEATKKEIVPEGDIVMGVDVAREGDDETVVCIRQGDKVIHIEGWAHQETQFSAGRVAELIRKWKPVVANIDVIGIGAGVVDPLVGEGYNVRQVNVGESAINKELYLNKRAEYFKHLQKKFEDGTIQIPDNPKLSSQLASLRYTYMNTKFQMESKKSMKSHGLPSPDYADALMLCFIGADIDSGFATIPVTHWG